MEDFIKLNPSIRHQALPDLSKPYKLYLPLSAKAILDTNRKAILDSASSVGKKELEFLARNDAGSTYGKDKIVYKVKSGDVLGSIALRHNVSVANLKKWNNLSSNTIRIGQRLNIWNKPGAYAKSTKTVAAAQPQPIPSSKTYIVQSGDTLWDISQKFQGLTIQKLKELNNLENTKIQPGQKLVVGI